MTTLVLALWLLGADANEPALFKQLVGPVLTEEKCVLSGAQSLGAKMAERLCTDDVGGVSYCGKEGRKVCVEVIATDARCVVQVGDTVYSANPSGCPQKLISRHCWCAEEEPAK
jgi:hypothetical protein